MKLVCRSIRRRTLSSERTSAGRAPFDPDSTNWRATSDVRAGGRTIERTTRRVGDARACATPTEPDGLATETAAPVELRRYAASGQVSSRTRTAHRVAVSASTSTDSNVERDDWPDRIDGRRGRERYDGRAGGVDDRRPDSGDSDEVGVGSAVRGVWHRHARWLALMPADRSGAPRRADACLTGERRCQAR